MRLRDGPYAEVHPPHLRQQVADLLLRQVVLRAQHPHQRQRPRPDLPAWYPGRQHAAHCLAAHLALAAVDAVLVHLGLYLLRHVEHLVAQRLALAGHLAAAFALRWRRAVGDPLHLRLFQQRPVRPGMAALGAALAPADASLTPVLARPVRQNGGLDELLESSPTCSCSLAICSWCTAVAGASRRLPGDTRPPSLALPPRAGRPQLSQQLRCLACAAVSHALVAIHPPPPPARTARCFGGHGGGLNTYLRLLRFYHLPTGRSC